MRIHAQTVAAAILASGLTAFLLRPPPAATALAPLRTDLGPADAILLAGTPEVKLANRGGRVSWGDQPGSRSFSCGMVDVGAALGGLLRLDRFGEELAAHDAESEQKQQGFQDRWQELQGEMRGIQPDDPAAADARQKLMDFRSEVESWSREAAGRRQEIMARQFESAWKELRSAVDVVAERHGIDLVYKSASPGDPFHAGPSDDLSNQVRARTFVRAPEDLDLTEEVLKELNVERPDPSELRQPDPTPGFQLPQLQRRGRGGPGGPGGPGGGQ